MNRRQRRYIQRIKKTTTKISGTQTYQDFINSVEMTPELINELNLYSQNENKKTEDSYLKNLWKKN